MSQQYDNRQRFVLFPNKRKETSKHPDLNGTINIEGQDYFFDAWVTWDGSDIGRINGKIGNAKTGGKGGGSGSSKSGNKPRRELGDDQPPRTQASSGSSFEDDDIPF